MSETGRAPAEYEEKHHFGILFYLLVLPLLGVWVAVLAGGIVKHNASYAIIAVLLNTLFLGFLLGFWSLTFRITALEVAFGFPLFKKRFPREKINRCEPYDLTFKNYMGYGIRLGWDGTIAYNTRNGAGIKLTVEGEKREYVVAVDSPPYICELLNGPGRSAPPR